MDQASPSQSGGAPSPRAAGPVLALDQISKTFPGTVALSDVSLEIGRQEVRALVGANGSGKSTLIKILAGYHRPDPRAEASFLGEPLDLYAPAASRPDGIRFIHQDLGLVLELNAVDNFGLKRSYASRGIAISWREQARRTRAALRRFDIAIDIHKPVSRLAPVERTLLAIAAAIADWDEEEGGLLVLDEPTAALPPVEVRALFEIVAEVRDGGASVLYVSHRLDEIFAICNQVTVLRGGKLVATAELEGLAPRELTNMMAGAEVDIDVRPTAAPAEKRPTVLEASDLHGRFLRGVDLEVGEGEVVGIAGLLGSGREELPYLLAGADRAAATGRLRFGGEAGEWLNVAYDRYWLPIVPADRVSEGVIGEMTVAENLVLPGLDQLGQGGVVTKRRARRMAAEMVSRTGVVPTDPERQISTLSGGNQQKVVIGRWLSEKRPLLVLSEPTAGVDVNARNALYELLLAEAAKGLTLVVASSDLEDFVHLCNRTVVLRDGVIAGELRNEEITEVSLLHLMEGTNR